MVREFCYTYMTSDFDNKIIKFQRASTTLIVQFYAFFKFFKSDNIKTHLRFIISDWMSENSKILG